MVEQHGWKQWFVSGLMVSMTAATGCAVAHAQTPPTGSRPPAATNADAAACPPDASQNASGDAGHAATAAATAQPAVAYNGPPPYYFVRPPRTTAGLTPDRVHRVLTRAANQQAITECYTRALATDPRAHALVSIRVEVIAGGFGTVDRVHLAPANDTMRDCIRDALSHFEWPNPSGVPATTVDAQIDLAPTPPPNPRARH
jgi:hypothetical protein